MGRVSVLNAAESLMYDLDVKVCTMKNMFTSFLLIISCYETHCQPSYEACIFWVAALPKQLRLARLFSLYELERYIKEDYAVRVFAAGLAHHVWV
jgi:hypothetical protein